MPLTPQDVADVLSYCPDDGKFRWRVGRNSFAGKAKPGETAGTSKDGYVQIGFHGRHFRAHRLAWFVMTGGWPPSGFEIDHINGNRADNRWSNLRLVTRMQNCMNAGNRTNNTTGRRGVYQRRDTGAWHARIRVYGELILLGQFATFDEASAARAKAEADHFGIYNRGL